MRITHGHVALVAVSACFVVWTVACSGSSSEPAPAPTPQSTGTTATTATSPATTPTSTPTSTTPTTTPSTPNTAGTPPPGMWNAFVGQSGVFGQTFDNSNWSTRAVAAGDLYSVTCADENDGWVSGANGFVARTNNGGASWTTLAAPFAQNLRAIKFASTTFGVVAGDNGVLGITSDGGDHFTAANVSVAVTTTLRSLTIANGTSLVLAAGDSAVLLRSEDSGAHFSPVTIANAGNFTGVASDSKGAFIAAVDALGNIFASRDGGKTFGAPTNVGAMLDAIAISDDGTRALAVGANGIAFASTGGAFTALATGTTAHLHTALISDDDTREYIAGDNGTLMTTLDHGAHFSVVPVTTQAAIYSLDDL